SPSAGSPRCWRRWPESRATIRSCRFRGSSNAIYPQSPASWLRPPKSVSSPENRKRPMRQFILPDLGEGLEEAEIVMWHVNEGDRVVVDQPLVSVETDKAVVEVPSPWSGRIARLFGGKGDLIKVGAPLVEFAEGEQGDTGTVVGELGQEEKAPRGAEAPAPTPARTLQVLPAVRALARKLDVDLNLVHATGPGGTDHARGGGACGKELGRGGSGRAAARHAPGHGATHGSGPRRGGSHHRERRG